MAQARTAQGSHEGTGTGPAAHQANGPAGDGAQQTSMVVKLPFFTATFTRPAGRGQGGHGPHVPTPSARAQRLAFYAGVAALGALEVVEWPVALLVAAGSYVAQKTRPAAPQGQPPQGRSPRDETPA